MYCSLIHPSKSSIESFKQYTLLFLTFIHVLEHDVFLTSVHQSVQGPVPSRDMSGTVSSSYQTSNSVHTFGRQVLIVAPHSTFFLFLCNGLAMWWNLRIWMQHFWVYMLTFFLSPDNITIIPDFFLLHSAYLPMQNKLLRPM